MKKLAKLTLLLVVLVVVAAVALSSWIDSGARSAVEVVLTEKLGTETTLADMSISFLDENCEMSGFKVANPAGFSSEPFFQLDRGYLALSARTLLNDVIRVGKLELQGITVNLEQNGQEGNYQAILEALSKSSGSSTDKGQKRFLIDEIVISDIKVNANLLGGAIVPPVALTIPEIRLARVGSESDQGVLLSEVAAQVMSAVFVEIGDTSGTLPGLMAQGLGQALGGLPNLESLTSRLSGGIDKAVGGLIKQGTQGLTEGINKVGEGLKKGLGGLLGGGKNK